MQTSVSLNELGTHSAAMGQWSECIHCPRVHEFPVQNGEPGVQESQIFYTLFVLDKMKFVYPGPFSEPC